MRRFSNAFLILICIFRINKASAQIFAQKDYVQTVIARNESWGKDLIKELKIGDTLPDLLLENVQNWHSVDAHFSEFQKELTIIDFWGITCGGCINSIPTEEALQNEFSDRLQILMVTRDSQAEVDHAKTKSDYLKGCNLPMYNYDGQFYKYFIYKTLPHFVWVNKSRVIIAYGLDLVNKSNLTAYFEKHLIPGRQNDAVFLDFNRRMPAFVEGSGRNFDKTRYYSVIMDTINGLGGTTRIQMERDSTTGNIHKLFLDNYPLSFLYRFLLLEEQHSLDGTKLGFVWDKRRTLFEITDSNLFRRAGMSFNNDRMPRLYCYEVQIPSHFTISLTKCMRTDLERYFGISCAIEKKKVKVWALRRKGGNRKFTESFSKMTMSNKTESAEDSYIGYNEVTKKVIIKNTSINDFLYYLQNEIVFANDDEVLPIVSDDVDSFALGKISCILTSLPNNGTKDKERIGLKDLQANLDSFGYELEKRYAVVPMVVFRDTQ